MNSIDIFSPMFAMMGLTIVVWAYMFALRIPAINKNKLDLQSFDTPKGREQLGDAVNYPAYNLQNLFEMPVLFYAICIVAFLMDVREPAVLYAAWIFVGFRTLHSLVHCTYNNVMHRFTLYFLSCFALFYMLYKVVRIYCA